MPRSDTQWKKGQSGNPAGRAKTKVLTDELRRILREPAEGSRFSNAHMVAWRVVQQAKAGDMTAARLLFEYLEGKPVQPVEVELHETIRRVAAERNLDPQKLTVLAELIANHRA